ncbi:MAG: Uncharacterised protein [Polaribacter sejongensis]|nr:MAG: Uncharacterised protein [Polaribacter sejongensis]
MVSNPIEDTVNAVGKLNTLIENSPASSDVVPLEEFPFSTIFTKGKAAPDESVTLPFIVCATIVSGNNIKKDTTKKLNNFLLFILNRD